MNSRKRIFSGIQPSGNLHIGNYLGAIKNWVELQNEYDSIFCVVDMHAITVPQDPETLRKKTIEVAKVYLAAGIDPKKCAIFIQSHVSEHAELMWILNTIARMSDMDKMTQFKDKSQKGGRETSGVGLYDYPVLMAADIILYDTQTVPVGQDQVQHIELTRTLARRFNKNFGDTFIVPEYFLKEESKMIMALDDIEKKMSKSAVSEYSYIALTDEIEKAKKKIMKAVTDSGTEISYTDDKPAIKNLINIYSLLDNKSTKEIVEMYTGKGYGDFKKGLADVVAIFLTDFQTKYNAISDDEALKILHAGAEKVRPIAKKKLDEVKNKVGFVS